MQSVRNRGDPRRRPKGALHTPVLLQHRLCINESSGSVATFRKNTATLRFVRFSHRQTEKESSSFFINHWVPDTIGNGVPAGGTIQLYAMQFRVALTERLSLIGVKDGYIADDTEGTFDTLLDDGWASVTAGLEYNLVRDAQTGTLASAGFTYELPSGNYLLTTFSKAFPQSFERVPNTFAMLEQVDGYIRIEVRKLYPDAELPRFSTRRTLLARTAAIACSTLLSVVFTDVQRCSYEPIIESIKPAQGHRKASRDPRYSSCGSAFEENPMLRIPDNC